MTKEVQQSTMKNSGMSPLKKTPDGWCICRLGDLTERSEYGTSLKCDYEGDGLPVIRIPNIVNAEVDFNDLKWTIAELKLKAGDELQPGDMLMCRTNGSISLVGKTAVIRSPLDCPHSFASYLLRFRFFEQDVLPKWVHFFFGSQGRAFVERHAASSAGQHNISLSTLHSMPLPIAPQKEQRRIVAMIEELFSDLDAGVVALGRVRANLKRYRAAVLKAAVEGKLTEDWRAQHPDSEPASILLKRLQGEQQGFLLPVSNGEMRNSRRSSRLAGSHSFDQHHQIETELPSGWALARLDQICKEIVDCPHSTPKWTDKGIACVRTTEFRPGRLLLDQVRYVSESTYQARIARLKPEPEDILYSREGGILGIACLVPPGVKLCLGQRMMLMRATVSNRYVMHVLNCPQILSLVAKLTGGSASPHLNVGDVKAFPIPFPPGAEQLAIVQEIESRLSIVDEVEAQAEVNLRRASRLRQCILKLAFEGRLVPQDPTDEPDEPAEKLLEPIRQQRQPATKMYNGRLGTRRARRPRRTSDTLLPFPRDDGNGQGGKP